MKEKEQKEVVEVVEKRGRPKGTGGNKRPDMSWKGNENLQPGDMGRFIRHALASWDMPPVDISDPKQVEERLLWYFNSCVEDDVRPTVSGICRSLGIDRRTFYQWGQGETRSSTHTPLIKKAYDSMQEMWEDQMVTGKVNPVVGIFLGKNHFGFKDQQDVVLTPKNPLGDMRNEQEIRERYVESVVEELPSHDDE